MKYTARRSEATFEELVRRHVDFVYSAVRIDRLRESQVDSILQPKVATQELPWVLVPRRQTQREPAP